MTLGLILAGAANAQALAAARLDYQIELGLLYDDNVHLTQSTTDADEILIPRLLFTFNDDSSRLKANIAGDLSYYDYLHGTFKNDFRGILAGTVLWHILPDRFDWVFEDYLGRQPVNVLLDNTPDNQQQTNFFVTGPTLKLHLSERFAAQLNLRVADSYAEKTSDFNGNRLSALATVVYESSPTSSLSANLQGQRVRYDSAPEALDYQRWDAYAGYLTKGARSEIEVDVGYTKLNFDHGGGSDSGVLLRTRLRFDASARSSFSLNAQRGFSDTAQDLIMDAQQLQNIDVGSGLNSMLVSPQAYTETRVDFTYAFTGERFRFSVAPFVRKLDYVSADTFNETARGGYAQATYQLSPRSSLSVFAGVDRRDYRNLTRTDNDRTLGLQFSHDLTRHWQWRVQVQQLERSSTAANFGYTDHQVLFTVRYSR